MRDRPGKIPETIQGENVKSPQAGRAAALADEELGVGAGTPEESSGQSEQLPFQ